MAVTANLQMGVNGSQTATADLGTVSYPFTTTWSASYTTSGTGAGQVDRKYTKTNTLAASGTTNVDLAGTLVDEYGATITFARIKSVFISASASNTNNVQLTRPASNGVPLFMAAGDGIELRPGAAFSWGSGTADATGVPVTAGTGDLLTLTNSGGTTGVTYTVVITGCSA